MTSDTKFTDTVGAISKFERVEGECRVEFEWRVDGGWEMEGWWRMESGWRVGGRWHGMVWGMHCWAWGLVSHGQWSIAPSAGASQHGSSCFRLPRGSDTMPGLLVAGLSVPTSMGCRPTVPGLFEWTAWTGPSIVAKWPL